MAGKAWRTTLAKYVVSPLISLRRLLGYDGQRVRYWYNDHKTKQRQEEEVPVLTFMGRMVQHILPKGFHRIRYYGLHATCKAKKVKVVLTVLTALGRLIRGRIASRRGPTALVCSPVRGVIRCGVLGGGEMILWQVWHPRYGVVYDELHEIKRGRYGPRRGIHQTLERMGMGHSLRQLALTGLL